MAQGNLQFIISVDSTGAVQGVRAFSGALNTLGPTAQQQSAKATSAFDRVEATLKKMQSAVIGFIGAFVFTRVIRGISEIIQTGIEFESSFTGIKKTVDGSVYSFAALSDEMIGLSKEMGISVNELNRIAQAAGQANIGVSDIREFTKAIAQIGITTGMATDEATTNFAQLANILQLPASSVRVLGSTMAALDRESVASSEQILQFSMNLGATAKNVSVAAPQVLALSAALASTGLHAEKAGSAMSRAFQDMEKAVAKGGSKLDEFAQVTFGASAKGADFAKVFKQDAGNALLLFLNGLAKTTAAGKASIITLEELGFKNVRITDVLQRLSLAQDKYADLTRVATAESKSLGETLDQRTNLVLGTTEKQLDKVNARLRAVFISISEDVTPSLISAGNAFASLAETLEAHGATVKQVIGTVLALVAAYALFRFAQYAATLQVFTGALFAYQAVAGSAATISEGLAFALGPLALGAAVVATTVLFVNFLEKLNRLKDDIAAIDDANKNAAKSDSERFAIMVKEAEAQRKLGFEVDTYGESLESVAKQLAKNRPAYMAMKAAQDAASKADETRRVKIEELSEAEKKRIEKVKDSIDDYIKAEGRLSQEIQLAEKAGLKAAQVMDLYGSKMEDAGEKSAKAGTLLDPVIAKYLALGRETERVREYTEEAAKTAQKSTQVWITYAQQVASAMEKASSFTQFPSEIPVHSIGTLPSSFGSPEDDNPNFIGPQLPSGKDLDKWIADNNKASREIARGLEKALDNVFEKLVKNSTLAWKDVAKFAGEVFENLGNTLFAPLKKNLLTPLSEQLGKIGENFNNMFFKKGADGAASTGMFAKLGDKLGGALGSVASAGIGAAISIGISTIAKLFEKSGSEVNNKLVKDIQNPFTKAVGDLHDSFIAAQDAGKLTLQTAVEARGSLTALLTRFKADTDAYASLGAKQSTAVQGAFAEIEKYWGKDLSIILEKVDAAIVELGGSAGMTVSELGELNESIKIMEDFVSDVKSVVDSVTNAADRVDVMVSALVQLREAGIPTGLVIDQLGSSIVDMAIQMRALGREVPAIVADFESMTLAINRLQAVENELKETRDKLASTLNGAIDANIREIEKSQNEIEKWNKRIVALNIDIEKAQEHLSDAKFWTEEYNKAIKESESAYKDAVKTREETERRIAELTRSIERDRLQAILDTASTAFESEKEVLQKAREARQKQLEDAIDANDENVYLSLEVRAEKRKILQKELEDFKKNKTDVFTTEATFLAAKKAMEDFDRAERLRQTKEQIDQLALLKESLGDQIRLEQERKLALDAAKVAAMEQIAADKEKLRVSLENMQTEKVALEANILAEFQHIAALKATNLIYENMLGVLGILRTSTDGTISSLVARGLALEAERVALSETTGTAQDTADAFSFLRDQFALLGPAADSAAAAITAASVTIGGAMLATRAVIGNLSNDVIYLRTVALDRNTGAVINQNPPGSGGGNSTGPLVPFYIPTGSQMNSAEERTVTLSSPTVNRSSQMVDNSISFGNITVHALPGQDGKSIANDFVRELELNGDLRRRVTRLTEKH